MVFRRTANVKRNIGFALIQVIVSQLLPFIVRTVLIYRFGVEYLGINSLFASILSVLSLMELGFGTAVAYSLYKPIAEGDIKSICAYLAYYRKVYRIVGLTILLIGLGLMPFLRYLVRDPVLPGGLNLYCCYAIFLGNTVVSYMLFGYVTVVPTAYQRRDILSRIGIFIALFRCTIQVLVLVSSINFYLYLFTMPVATIVENIVTYIVVRKIYPEIKCVSTIELEQKRALNKKVYGLFINKITTVSRNSIDSLCISTFIGLAVTGIYSNYYYIMASLVSFSTIVCNSMIASVGNSIATENTDKNYSDMRLFDFIYMAIAGWAAVCLFMLYQPFMVAWTGTGMMLDISAVIGLSFYYYILKAGDIRWVYHEGAGLWWECRHIMIGEAVANVVLNVVLCKFFGVTGIIMATVISVFITNCVLCPIVVFNKYFKNGKLKEYWMDHIWYTITMVITAGMCWLISNYVFPMSMIAERNTINIVFCLLGRLAVCSVLSIAIFWLVWRRSERYARAVEWMKKFIKV